MIDNFNDFMRYSRIHDLIKRKSATIEQLTAKINKNKRTIQRYISEMKDYGFPIALCKWRKTYFYTDEVEFEIKFKVFKKSEIEDPDKLKGGYGFVSYFQDFFSEDKKKFLG
jgi:predicted DNA-binding transcriptional regulator YafY